MARRGGTSSERQVPQDLAAAGNEGDSARPDLPDLPDLGAGWGFLVGVGRAATAGLVRAPATAALAVERKLSGVPSTWAEDYKDVGKYYSELEAAHPTASLVGEVTGAIVPGAGLAKGARVAQAVAGAGKLGTAARVGTTVGGNAALGAVSAGMTDKSIGEGASFGALAGLGGEALGAGLSRYSSRLIRQGSEYAGERLAAEAAKIAPGTRPLTNVISEGVRGVDPSKLTTFKDLARHGVTEDMLTPDIVSRAAKADLLADTGRVVWAAAKGTGAYYVADKIADGLNLNSEQRGALNTVAAGLAGGIPVYKATAELTGAGKALLAGAAARSTARALPPALPKDWEVGAAKEATTTVSGWLNSTKSTSVLDKAKAIIAPMTEVPNLQSKPAGPAPKASRWSDMPDETPTAPKGTRWADMAD